MLAPPLAALATAPELDARVAAAGAWCLAVAGRHPAAWEVRAAAPGDLEAMLDVERRGFPAFERPSERERAEIYAGPSGGAYGVGRLLRVLVAERGTLRAYCIAQWRGDELYLYEMAVRPVPRRERDPRLGGFLLAVVARLAHDLGCGLVTANVRRLDREARLPGYDSAALVRHCRRYGFPESPTRGVLSLGQPADPSDSWLSASPGEILANFRGRHPPPAPEAAPAFRAPPPGARHASARTRTET